MTSSDGDRENISTELNHLSLKRQQLMERRKIQCMFQEMKNRAEFGQTEAASNLHEIDNIDDELKQLRERKAELQINHENFLSNKDMKNDQKDESKDAEDMKNDQKDESKDAEDMKNDVSVSSSQIVPDVPVPLSNIFYVEGPPNIPAPTVILDVKNLLPCPCRTQCPECKEFIMTETFTSVSSVTWMMCFMMASIGCVAGCCLIPFCMDKFKSLTHRCPRCRTSIMTIKKL